MSDVPETGRNDSDWLTAAATEVNFDYEVIMRPDTVVPDRYAAGLDSFNYSITALMPLTLNDLQIDFSRVTREYGYPVYKIKMGAERDVVTEVEAHPAEVVDDTMFSHICAVIMKGLNNDGQDFRRVFPHGQGAFLHILPSTDNSYRHITYIGPHSGKYLFKTTLSSNSNRSNVVNHSTRAAIRETKALLGQAQGPLRGGECRRFYMSSGMLDKVYERIQFQEDNTQMQEPLGSPSTHIVPPHEVGCMPWAMSASSYLTDYGKFLLGYALYTCNMNPSANFYVSFDLGRIALTLIPEGRASVQHTVWIDHENVDGTSTEYNHTSIYANLNLIPLQGHFECASRFAAEAIDYFEEVQNEWDEGEYSDNSRIICFLEQRDDSDSSFHINLSDISHHYAPSVPPSPQNTISYPPNTLAWCLSQPNLDEETRGNLNYIQKICDTAMIDISNWNLTEIFYKDGKISVDSQGELNPIIFADRLPSEYLDFEKAPEEEKVEDLLEEEIVAMAKKAHESITLWADNVVEKREELVNLYEASVRALEECTSDLTQYNKHLHFLNLDPSQPDPSTSNTVEGIKRIVSSGLYDYLGTNEKEDALIFKNNLPFFLKHKKNGTLHKIKIGTFHFHVRMTDFKTKAIVCDPMETPMLYYKHPYLPLNDYICFGSEETRRCRFATSGDIYNHMLLIRDLFISYNESNPHIRIGAFIEAQATMEATKSIVGLRDPDDFVRARDLFNKNQGNNDMAEYSRQYLMAITPDRNVVVGAEAIKVLLEERHIRALKRFSLTHYSSMCDEVYTKPFGIGSMETISNLYHNLQDVENAARQTAGEEALKTMLANYEDYKNKGGYNVQK